MSSTNAATAAHVHVAVSSDVRRNNDVNVEVNELDNIDVETSATDIIDRLVRACIGSKLYSLMNWALSHSSFSKYIATKTNQTYCFT